MCHLGLALPKLSWSAFIQLSWLTFMALSWSAFIRLSWFGRYQSRHLVQKGRQLVQEGASIAAHAFSANLGEREGGEYRCIAQQPIIRTGWNVCTAVISCLLQSVGFVRRLKWCLNLALQMYTGALSVDDVFKRLLDMKAENSNLGKIAIGFLVRSILNELTGYKTFAEPKRKLIAALLGGIIRESLNPYKDLQLEAMQFLLVSPSSAYNLLMCMCSVLSFLSVHICVYEHIPHVSCSYGFGSCIGTPL